MFHSRYILRISFCLYASLSEFSLPVSLYIRWYLLFGKPSISVPIYVSSSAYYRLTIRRLHVYASDILEDIRFELIFGRMTKFEYSYWRNPNNENSNTSVFAKFNFVALTVLPEVRRSLQVFECFSNKFTVLEFLQCFNFQYPYLATRELEIFVFVRTH